MSAGKVRWDPKPAVLNSSIETSGMILIKICSCVRKGSSVQYILEPLGSKIILFSLGLLNGLSRNC